MTRDLQRLATMFLSGLPHARMLDLQLVEIGPARVVLDMPWHESLVGDSESGVIHGGTVTALLDTAAGTAVMAHPDEPAATATLDLRLDYMRAAKPHERIRAEAICYHLTRHVAFVRARAWDESGNGDVAAAAGAFSITPAKEAANGT